MVLPSGLLPNAPRKRARKLTGWRARLGITICLDTKALRNRPRRLATPGTPDTFTLRVRCLGCDTHQTVALDIVRQPKATPIHELERYMRCKDCSQVRGYLYKRSHLVALRPAAIYIISFLMFGSATLIALFFVGKRHSKTNANIDP
jgi:hypothetical protein